MATFEFESGDLHLSFEDHLRCGGWVESYCWRRLDGSYPDLSGYAMSWSLATGSTPFEAYAEFMSNRGSPLSSRIPNFAEYWGTAKGLMWVDDGKWLHVVLASPDEPGFAAFVVAAFAAKLRLFVTVEVYFAPVETAPGPSPAGFLARGEPLFMRDAPKFSLQQPGTAIGRRNMGWLVASPYGSRGV